MSERPICPLVLSPLMAGSEHDVQVQHMGRDAETVLLSPSIYPPASPLDPLYIPFIPQVLSPPEAGREHHVRVERVGRDDKATVRGGVS
jgi:hypothetical protein